MLGQYKRRSKSQNGESNGKYNYHENDDNYEYEDNENFFSSIDFIITIFIIIFLLYSYNLYIFKISSVFKPFLNCFFF